MITDSNGQEIKVGDEITVSGTIVEIQDEGRVVYALMKLGGFFSVLTTAVVKTGAKAPTPVKPADKPAGK